MAWYDRFHPNADRAQDSLPMPASEYPIEVAPEPEASDQNWLMLGLLVIAALALAVLVSLTARWAVHHDQKNSSASTSSKGLPASPPTNLNPGD